MNYNCFNEPFAVSPYRSLYRDMHGLIFETSIWLLAGSTRFLNRTPLWSAERRAWKEDRLKQLTPPTTLNPHNTTASCIHTSLITKLLCNVTQSRCNLSLLSHSKALKGKFMWAHIQTPTCQWWLSIRPEVQCIPSFKSTSGALAIFQLAPPFTRLWYTWCHTNHCSVNRITNRVDWRQQLADANGEHRYFNPVNHFLQSITLLHNQGQLSFSQYPPMILQSTSSIQYPSLANQTFIPSQPCHTSSEILQGLLPTCSLNHSVLAFTPSRLQPMSSFIHSTIRSLSHSLLHSIIHSFILFQGFQLLHTQGQPQSKPLLTLLHSLCPSFDAYLHRTSIQTFNSAAQRLSTNIDSACSCHTHRRLHHHAMQWADFRALAPGGPTSTTTATTATTVVIRWYCTTVVLR